MKKLSMQDKLFVFSVLMNSGTALKQDTRIASIAMLFFYFLYVITQKKLTKKYIKSVEMVLFISIIIIAHYILMNGIENIQIVVQILVLFLVSTTYTFLEPEKNYQRIRYFVQAIIFTSIISTILYLFIVLGISIPYTGTTLGTNTIWYLENFTFDGRGFFGIRNAGIFWEPGMYQIYLNFAIIYLLYSGTEWHKKLKKYLIAYLVIAIGTTYSTSGYVLCAALIVYYILAYRKVNLKKIVLIILGVILAIYAAPLILNNINNKLSVGNSFNYRYNDIYIGVKLILKHPIWGYGINSDMYYQYHSISTGVLRGNSNGIMNILIYFGFIGLPIYFYCFTKTINIFKDVLSKESRGAIWIWLIVSVCSEPIVLHPFIFFFIGLGVSCKNNRESNNEEKYK